MHRNSQVLTYRRVGIHETSRQCTLADKKQTIMTTQQLNAPPETNGNIVLSPFRFSRSTKRDVVRMRLFDRRRRTCHFANGEEICRTRDSINLRSPKTVARRANTSCVPLRPTLFCSTFTWSPSMDLPISGIRSQQRSRATHSDRCTDILRRRNDQAGCIESRSQRFSSQASHSQRACRSSPKHTVDQSLP